MSIIFGIDQSYRKCGVVILNSDDITHMEIISANKELDIFDQATDVANKISGLITKFTPKIVGLEGLAYSSQGNRTRDLGGLFFTIILMLRYIHFFTDIPIVPPTTLKKFATGHGRSKKKELHEALPENIKELIRNNGFTSIAKGREDITDAYWVAKYLQENK